VKGRPRRGENRIPKFAVVRDARKYWSGVTGDPTKASPELGRKVDRFVEEMLVAVVRGAAKRRV